MSYTLGKVESAKIWLGVWDCHFKVRFIGSYWKVAFVLNLAKWLGLETQYYMAGTGRGE